MKTYEAEATPRMLDELARDIAKWALEKGFWEHPLAGSGAATPDYILARLALLKKCEKNALFTSEVAEHLEALRKPELPSTLKGFSAEEEELADILIRVLDYAGHYRMRIGEAVCAKMAKNEKRPYKHGKQF